MKKPTASQSTTNDQSDCLLNNQKAAEYIGIDPGTLSVWRCVKRHNIAYIKVGRLVKYRKSALDEFLNRNTKGLEASV